MLEEIAEIEFNSRLTGDTFLMGIRASLISQSAGPGQFIMIRVADSMEPLLRRPFSI